MYKKHFFFLSFVSQYLSALKFHTKQALPIMMIYVFYSNMDENFSVHDNFLF